MVDPIGLHRLAFALTSGSRRCLVVFLGLLPLSSGEDACLPGTSGGVGDFGVAVAVPFFLAVALNL